MRKNSDLFDTLLDKMFYVDNFYKTPFTDIIKNDDNFIIELSLAGLNKDDVTIKTEDDVLTIEAERKKRENIDYQSIETFYGKYKKIIELPDYIDIDKITAEMKNGILTIILPKKETFIRKDRVISIE